MKYTNRWALPEVVFYQAEDHGFISIGQVPLYGYAKPDDLDAHGYPKIGEFHLSLDRALIAWVAEKYTGPRGAGGPGVGTAADWFARMIGMDDLVPAEYGPGNKALTEALVATADYKGAVSVRASRMAEALEARGMVLAAAKKRES